MTPAVCSRALVVRACAVLVGALGPVACHAPVVTEPVTTVASGITSSDVPAPELDEVHVEYREAADVFELVDNASNWWPDKCDVAYRDAWQRQLGVTVEDGAAFSSYAELRKKYFPRPPDEAPRDAHGLLAELKPPDLVAEAFYGSRTLPEAYAKLASFMDLSDARALAEIFESLRPRFTRLLAESAAYPELATRMDASLRSPQALEFRQKLQRFYGVKRARPMTVLYVWWPPVESIQANHRGSFLLLKYNPLLQREDALRDVDIPMHELVHELSARLPVERKLELSLAFRAGCAFHEELDGPRVLEEPLAVAQQQLFLRSVAPERFSMAKGWYGDPWVSTLSQAIYADVEHAYASGGVLDEALMAKLAARCPR